MSQLERTGENFMKSWFDVAVYGQNATLAEIEASLNPAVAKRRAGGCDFILNVVQVFPDICIGGDAAILELAAGNWHIITGLSPFSSKLYELEFCGDGDRATWLAFLDRLSTRFPATTIRFSGATDHGECEEWTATGGERTIISASYKAVQPGLTIVYVRDGVTLDPPELEGGMPDGEEVPVIISAPDLARMCESEWHFFFAGRECPGVKSRALFKRAEEFANRGLNHNDLPSADVLRLARDIAEKPKGGGTVIPNGL
jgi:hypothetical protein